MAEKRSKLPLVIAAVLLGWAFGVVQVPDLPDWIPLPNANVDSPIDAPGLHVMIVEETENRHELPESQLQILTSTKVRKWLNEKTAREDGHPAWRLFDANATLDHENRVWRDAFARPRTELPWIVISNSPHGGVEQPLPESIEETMALLEQWKGRSE